MTRITLLIIVTINFSSQHIAFGQDTALPVDFESVAPILAENCSPCHTGKHLGPMPLMTYREVSSYGEMIKFLVVNQYMPPWLPDHNFSVFKNERVLTDDEINLIKDWVNEGMDPGSIGPEEPIYTLQHNNEKSSGFKLCMDQSFEQYGIYKDQFQVFVIPANNTSSVWASKFKLHIGNTKIVRSCKVSVCTSDKWHEMDNWDPRYGYYSFGGLGDVPKHKLWYSWSPLNPEDIDNYRFLPPDAYLLLEIHYGPIGKPSIDSTCISFDTTSFYEHVNPISSSPFINLNNLSKNIDTIPAGKSIRVHAAFELPFAMDLYAVFPAANLICRNWEVYATYPSRTVLPLLKINDWLVDWAEKYHFKNPVHLPKGTIIHALATYDNTIDNPHNPAFPPIPMTWGHGMFKERFEVVFDYKPQSRDITSFHIAPLPTVEEGNNFRMHYYSNRDNKVRIELISLPNHLSHTAFEVNIIDGCDYLDIATSQLPRGEYHVKVLNSEEKLMAEDILIISREESFFR